MILIFSNYLDHSTIHVTDWLLYNEAKFKRVDGTDFKNFEVPLETILTNEGTLIKIDDIDLPSIKSVWYRRWLNYNEIFADELGGIQTDTVNDSANIKRHLVIEMRKSYNSLFRFLEKSDQINVLPKFSSASVDKMAVLEYAVQFGLNVPPTIICNTKKALQAFKKKYQKIINKPISEVTHYRESADIRKYVRTIILDDSALQEFDDEFFPSLFQQYIEKQLEIRSFYLDGKFYSMAIFSQLDDKTSIDFRNYNREHPNRNVPFKLPLNIEDKLLRLMEKLDLQTGSIDLILDKKDEFHFLEVNPIGQFGMTSYPCNYYLEKKIAEYLNNSTNE